MSTSAQEWIVFAIVFLVGCYAGWNVFRATLAEPLAKWLLKRGKVKWAMRIYPRFNASDASRSSGDCH